jgi:hypothetical protein
MYPVASASPSERFNNHELAKNEIEAPLRLQRDQKSALVAGIFISNCF